MHGLTSAQKLSSTQKKQFVSAVWSYYDQNRRSFAWRNTTNPYHIVVSEIMLQQTQTERVKSKYDHFITVFPTLESLAQASLPLLLATWQGLGYNRRALALQLLAQRIVSQYNGIIPDEPSILQTFKGIGAATASSICAFAFNRPTLFIETNIRAVYIHHFFFDQVDVKDTDLMPLIEQTVDQKDPRNWYYALMDYGVMLKKEHKNPSRRSAHHSVQSKFEGSDRQVRGAILEILIDIPYVTQDDFKQSIPRKPEKIEQILGDLEREGFITQQRGWCIQSEQP